MPAPPPPSDFPAPPPRPTAVAIAGTDLVLAAFPATPVQLSHALQRLGFDVVVPASWGDELLAGATLERLDERGGVPAVFCACPRVAERLLSTGPELASVLLPLVSPAVATARYVRAAYAPAPVTVTYVGGCAAIADDSIDARITPREFMRALHDRGITLGEMPRVFEGVIPPDRRRHLSLPGGLPTASHLEALTVPRRLACLTSADYAAELAQLVLAREPVLIDVAARLGCACAGATAATPFERTHETVARLEPPRASHPVVERSLVEALDASLPEIRPPAPPPPPEESRRPSPPGTPRVPTPPRAVPAFSPRTGGVQTPPSRPHSSGTEPPTGASRRRAPRGAFRALTGEAPRAMTGEGLALPRAYVAKRRGQAERTSGETTPPPGVATTDPRVPTAERELPIARHVEGTPAAAPVPPVAPATPVVPDESHPAAPPATPPRRITSPVSRHVATPTDPSSTEATPVVPMPAVRASTPATTPATTPLPAAVPVPPPAAAPAPAQGNGLRPTPAAAPAMVPPARPSAPAPRATRPAPRAPEPPAARGLTGRDLLVMVVVFLLGGLTFALFR